VLRVQAQLTGLGSGRTRIRKRLRGSEHILIPG
jgi:hypothetical protein